MVARRSVFFGLVSLTAAFGAFTMLGILSGSGLTWLEFALLALFVPTFAWIALAFWNAVVGGSLLMLGRDPLTLAQLPSRTKPDPTPGLVAFDVRRGPETGGRTALAIPVRHEDFDAVLERVNSMLGSLEATGESGRFEVHLLSDSTVPQSTANEVRTWADFRASYAGSIPVTYRRRSDNTGRKAGNLREFCERAGHRFEYLVVLDADSLMSGETLVELAHTMDANPDAGILQTVPLPFDQTTRFGTILQFGAAVSSRLLASGQAFWQGDAANYWGHNAIIRMEPFVRHCALPVLPGRAPLGGEILSHDFVEAALMRRAGWKVYLLAGIGGSWEGVPTNLLAFALRDRRWAQGSLQHLRLLTMRGLHPLSRLHFLLGAMGYVSSLLWLTLLLGSTLYVALHVGGVGLGVAIGARQAEQGLAGSGTFSLLVLTGVLLFLPKLIALIAGVRRAHEFGGRLRYFGACLVEGGFSVLVAPILMMFHTRAVVEIAAGRAVSWGAQVREAREVTQKEARDACGWILLFGAAWAGATWGISPEFFLWLSPIFVGLLFVLPIVRWSGATSGTVDQVTYPQRGLTVDWTARRSSTGRLHLSDALEAQRDGTPHPTGGEVR